MTGRSDLEHAAALAEHQVGLDPAAPLARRVGANLWIGNLIGAILAVALGVAMIIAAVSFGFGTPAKLGAGVFPALTGALLALLGAMWLSQALLGRVRREEAESPPDRGGWLRIGATIVVVAGFALLVDVLGYQVAMLLAVAVLMSVIARTRWWVTMIVAIAFAFGTFTLFDYGLGVPLPVSELALLQRIGL